MQKDKEKTLQRFYWYALKDDIYLHIRKCDICAKDKKPVKPPKAPLVSLSAGAPGNCIATDYLGPFPVTERGNRYILLLKDHFSKYVEILAVADMTAEVCASRIVNEFNARWGCPLTIHSYQGRTYESNVFKEMCRMLEIRKSRTSARNPQDNGQSERFNRTLLRRIKAYLCGEQQDWNLLLGCLAGAYRATPHESTSLTPNLLTMGREVHLPAELVFGSTISDTLMYYEIECNTLIKLQENIYLLQPKEEKNSMTQRLHSTDTHREMLYGALMSQGRWGSCKNCNQRTVDHSW